VPATCSSRRGPAPERTDGLSTPRCGRCPYRRNHWRASGTAPTCCASTAATDGWLTSAGLETKQRVESLTDELAAPAYDILEPDEVEQLVEALEPLAAVLVAAGSQ
jgi:hypothetical protein